MFAEKNLIRFFSEVFVFFYNLGVGQFRLLPPPAFFRVTFHSPLSNEQTRCRRASGCRRRPWRPPCPRGPHRGRPWGREDPTPQTNQFCSTTSTQPNACPPNPPQRSSPHCHTPPLLSPPRRLVPSLPFPPPCASPGVERTQTATTSCSRLGSEYTQKCKASMFVVGPSPRT